MADLSLEQQYMIAMIVLACVAGILLIAFFIACCCCVRFQQKIYGGGSSTGYVKQEVHSWPVTACDSWGATPYGSTTPYNHHENEHHRNSAYDWALPTVHGPCVRQGNDYGKVLLNPPGAVCTKAAMPSTKLAGSCGNGGGCDGKFYQSSGQVLGSSAAQFVLESGASRYH